MGFYCRVIWIHGLASHTQYSRPASAHCGCYTTHPMDISNTLSLTNQQRSIIQNPTETKLFLEGPVGSGKTTVGAMRLLHHLESQIWPSSILVLTPQRSLATPYSNALRNSEIKPPAQVEIATMNGLAQRMIELFWPLIAEDAGFAHPEEPPTFLTIETAQYFMASVVQPLRDRGFFESVSIRPSRLYSQILDNLNKAAVVGFPHSEIGKRLNDAWLGEEVQRRIYSESQECANRFRVYCLENNLLDFSLQIEVFIKNLWTHPLCRDYLNSHYRHVIADNIEEDTPVAHDILLEWLPELDSALLIYDQNAGYRRFLGADPVSALRLKDSCERRFILEDSFVTSPELKALAFHLAQGLGRPGVAAPGNPGSALVYKTTQYYPEMLDWIADEIADLVHKQATPPGEIAVLAPFMSDALRFSLQDRLNNREVPSHSHRPSRALKQEAAVQCMLTLTALAHPDLEIQPTQEDVVQSLTQAIQLLDPVRAHLLAHGVYKIEKSSPLLLPFESVPHEIQERVTFVLGERYELLRAWMERYKEQPPIALDFFLSRLFGELLSQPGFGFHEDLQAGYTIAKLIESARKFRWVTSQSLLASGDSIMGEYLRMVQDDVIAAQNFLRQQDDFDNSVLLAPAFSFLMSNQAVDYQFWLNVGSMDWWRRIYQPLTHPYVLSRNWPRLRQWQDAEEYESNQDTMHRLTQGLISRCRKGIYLGFNEIGPSGFEEQGPLLRTVQHVLRKSTKMGRSSHV